MKNIYKILSFIFILSANNINGQNITSFITSKVEKSKKVIVINNKKYYIHTVKQGQTLYSISKAYNCLIDSIVGKTEILKIGQELKIPFYSENKTANIKTSTNSKLDTIYISNKNTELTNQINNLNEKIDKLNKEIKQNTENHKQPSYNTKSTPTIIKVFFNFNTSLKENNSAFSLKKVMLGYNYKFSKLFSTKVVMDISDPGIGKLHYTVFPKFASLIFKKNKITIKTGLISTKLFIVQHKFWGKRYLYKSFTHEHKYEHRSDLGISASYKIIKQIEIDGIVENGEGEKNFQLDNNYRSGFGITIFPIKNLVSRIYYDFIDGGNAQQNSLIFFLGYKYKNISLGSEYNIQNNNKNILNNNLYGFSAYSFYNFYKKFEIFARYDKLSSNETWNQNKDGYAFIGGIQYKPIKGINISLDFQNWTYTKIKKEKSLKIFLHFEYKL